MTSDLPSLRAALVLDPQDALAWAALGDAVEEAHGPEVRRRTADASFATGLDARRRPECVALVRSVWGDGEAEAVDLLLALRDFGVRRLTLRHGLVREVMLGADFCRHFWILASNLRRFPLARVCFQESQAREVEPGRWEWLLSLPGKVVLSPAPFHTRREANVAMGWYVLRAIRTHPATPPEASP